MQKHFTLIHTALLSEAKPIIERFALRQYDTKPFKVFKNGDIVLVVSGIGRDNTINALDQIFSQYAINKAINIGTAGCGDKKSKIGEIYCTNRKIENILHKELITVDKPQTPGDSLVRPDSLFDMEGSFFLEICSNYLMQENICILKVVSDRLDDTIPKKEFVHELISDSIGKWEGLI